MIRVLGTLLVLATPALAAAQAYDGSPCACGEKKGRGSSGFPADFATDGNVGDSARNASSCLYAGRYKGTIVPREMPEEDAQLDAWEQAREAYDRHTCRYSAHAVGDGDPKTAWCEGVDGDGVGEVVGWLANDGVPTQVEIFAGFGKSESLHGKNNRPKAVRLWIKGAKVVSPTQGAVYFGDLETIASSDVTLLDRYGFQGVALPNVQPETAKKYVAIMIFVEIKSVHRGSKWRDTCISEIRVPKGS